MNYPFPKLFNTPDTPHDHKDIKKLVLNVTDNTSIKRIGKKTRIKCKPNLEQEYPRRRSSPIKVQQPHKQIIDGIENISVKEEPGKCLRSLASAFNEVEDMLHGYSNDET